MREKYLPIGTVVLLKEATKRLMITGYCSAKPDESEKIYDYVGILFPEGNLVGDDVALFNHDQISVISHMGLDDEEFKTLESNIKSALTVDNNQSEAVLTPINNGGGSEMPTLAPFTPDNINNILTQIKNGGDAFKPISEPTAFNEDVIKKPAFKMPVLGGDSSKDEKKEEKKEIIKVSGIGSSEIEENVGDTISNSFDGEPVLKLEPIFSDNSTSDSSEGGASLSRL